MSKKKLPESVLPKAYLRNRLYVPSDYIKPYQLQPFEYKFDFSKWEDESLFEDEFDLDYQVIKTYQEVTTVDGDYHAFNRGDLTKIQNIFGDSFDIIDERTNSPLPFQLKLVSDFEYRGEQESALKKWTNPNLGGILKAPPAFGKTVELVLYILAQNQRTLILTDQTNLLEQFQKEFYKFTNAKKLEKTLGYRICDFLHRNHGTNPPPISLSSYQYFITNPDYLLTCSSLFGLVAGDEIHVVGAKQFCKCFCTLNPLLKVGMTATDWRKDGLHVLFNDIVGPVRYSAQRTEFTPCTVITTGVDVHPQLSYPNLLTRLSLSKKRNNIIAKETKAAIAKGHKAIIIVARVNHAYLLAKKLRVKYKVRAEGLAGPNKWQTDELKRKIEDDELDCIVAIDKLFGKGFNLPQLSHLGIAVTTSNDAAIEQWIGRVERSNVDGKLPPEAKYYADSGHVMAYGCRKAFERICRKLKLPCVTDSRYYSEVDKSLTTQLGRWSPESDSPFDKKTLFD